MEKGYAEKFGQGSNMQGNGGYDMRRERSKVMKNFERVETWTFQHGEGLVQRCG